MMSRIGQWLERWKYRILARTASRNGDRSMPVSGTPGSALILITVDNPKVLDAACRLLASWEARGIRTRIVGYFPDKADHPEADISWFNRKALRWTDEPRGDLIDSLRANPVDWLIQVGHRTILPLDWLAATLPAGLTIGPGMAPDFYQLKVDTPFSDPGSWTGHVERILHTLQTTAHATA